jgi:hypothetical protein
MTGKKVEFGPRPAAKPNPDAWVGERKDKEATKRLTLDIPASLHGKIKSSCALRGSKMIDEITELLTDKYGK